MCLCVYFSTIRGTKKKKKVAVNTQLFISNCRLRDRGVGSGLDGGWGWGGGMVGVLMITFGGPTTSASPNWITLVTFIHTQNTVARGVSGRRGRGPFGPASCHNAKIAFRRRSENDVRSFPLPPPITLHKEQRVHAGIRPLSSAEL